MRRSRHTTLGLLRTHLGSRSGAARLLGLMVFLTVFLLALAPRALPLLGNAELQHELQRLSPLDSGLLATGEYRFPTGTGDRAGVEEVFGPAGTALATLPDRLDHPLARLVGSPAWLARTPSQRTEPPGSDDIALTVALAVDVKWQSRVRFVDGGPPAPWARDDEDAPIEIALSVDAAEAMSLQVGDLLAYSPAPLKVSGSYKLTDPDDPYWEFAGDLADARQTAVANGSFFSAAAYVDPNSAAGLAPLFSGSTLTAWFPIDVADIRYSESAVLLQQVLSTRGLGISVPSGGQLVVTTGVGSALENVSDRVNAFTALIALAISGPIGVLFAVNALGVQSVIAGRRRALALASARGASGLRLRTTMLLEGAIVALPAAALAIALASLLLPTRVGIGAIVLPVLFAIALPLMFAAMTPMHDAPPRSDASVRSRGRYRWVIEAAIAGFACLSLLLLMRRGLVESSAAVGIDPLLAAMPLLLAVTVCLLVLRFYPVPLLALLRGLRVRRGAIGMLGAVHAVRVPSLGFAAAFSLVVGMAFAVFSGVLATTVSAAIQSTAAAEVGADMRIEARVLHQDTLAEVAAVEGVHAVAGLGFARQIALEPDNGREVPVTVVFADTEALQQIWAEVPGGLGERAGTRIPILASSDIAEVISGNSAQLGGSAASIVGSLPESTLPGMTRRWVVVDRAFASELSGSPFEAVRALAAVGEGADRSAVAAQVRPIVLAAQRSDRDADSVQVLDTSTRQQELTARPVVTALRFALAGAASAGLLLSSLTVVVATVASTARRKRTLGVLRTLGLSSRQAGSLALWELVPVAVTAVVAGASLGLALPWVVTAVLDLRPFVGGTVSPAPSTDLHLVTATVTVFALVVAVAGATAVTVARRLGPGQVLRMGEE